jgi:hypothetical protein
VLLEYAYLDCPVDSTGFSIDSKRTSVLDCARIREGSLERRQIPQEIEQSLREIVQELG